MYYESMNIIKHENCCTIEVQNYYSTYCVLQMIYQLNALGWAPTTVRTNVHDNQETRGGSRFTSLSETINLRGDIILEPRRDGHNACGNEPSGFNQSSTQEMKGEVGKVDVTKVGGGGQQGEKKHAQSSIQFAVSWRSECRK